jgi:hypothetical protein
MQSAHDQLTTPDHEETAAEEDALRGVRFIRRYEARAHLHRLHPARLWRLIIGLGLLAFGIVNIFIPGPGGSVIILASLLILAGESKLLARMFDWFEVRFARQVDWALEHKVLTICLVSGAAFIAVFGLGYLYTQIR